MHLELLKQDLLRWCDAEKKSYSLISAIRLWMKYDEFKCLVNYRLKSTKMSKFCKIFSRAEKRHNLYIYMRIMLEVDLCLSMPSQQSSMQKV